MAGTGATYVSEGQEHGVDPALIVGISGIESGFGKSLCAPYNAWGWFWSGNPATSYFDSWAEGIHWVTYGIARNPGNYFAQGRYSVSSIGPVYCTDGNAYSRWIPFVSNAMRDLGSNPDDCRWTPVVGADAPPTMGWWGPWGGAPVIAGEDTALWVKAYDDKAVNSVGLSVLHSGAWEDLGPATHGSGPDWTKVWWPTINTSQKVTIRAVVTDSSGKQVTGDYPRYITEEQWTVSGDFDGNGRDDIARLVDDGSNAISVWAGMSDGERLNWGKAFSATQWGRLRTKVFAGDVDGDGRDEMLAFLGGADSNGASNDACSLRVFDYASGAFTQKQVWSTASGWAWERVKLTAGDVDADGRDEVCAVYDYDGWSGWDCGLWVWQLTDSTATAALEWKETTNGWYDWNSSNFLCADIDGNGRDELCSYYNYGGASTGLFTFVRQSDGTWTRTRIWYTTTGWEFKRTKPTAGDFDGDGRDEIANFYNYAGWNNYAVGVWVMGKESDGSISNTCPWTVPKDQWDWNRVKPAAGDVDHDGRDELMALYDYHWDAASDGAMGLFFWRPDKNWGLSKPWMKPGGAWNASLVPAQTGALTVAPAAVELALSAQQVAYAGATTVSGLLKDADGKALAGRAVRVEQSDNGTSWTLAKSVTTASNGSFTAVVTPTRTTYYRAVAVSSIHPQVASSILKVTPCAYLGTPSASTTQPYANRYFTVSAYLKPRHSAGAYPVKLYCYRYESGVWKLRKTVSAKASNYASYTKVAASVKLPYKGGWRIRAYHAADSLNAATYSGYRYVTAR